MYKSGDLGRYLPDGSIEYLGRNDFQVKIRGFRIELGEIEAKLAQNPAVREAVVIARENGEDKRLTAYYTLAPGAEAVGAEELRRHLAAVLPDYMVASAYVRLDAFPLTENGKLDRKALPAPESVAYAAPIYEAPAGEVETGLAEIWADVLKLDRVGAQDNFFELGGHSLLAVRLVARVAAAFGVKLRIGALFDAPTLREFAALIPRIDKAVDASDIVRIQPEGNKTPIIAIHNTLMYYKLAKRIGKDRPFFGIKLFDEGERRPLPTGPMPAIAADYVRVIRAAQPHGPYILVGLCVAGVIAYEAARQLRQEGEQVPLVVMADTVRPGYEEGLPLGKRLYLRWAEHFHVLQHRINLIRSGKLSIAKVLSFYTFVRRSWVLDLMAKLGLIDPKEIGKDDWETWLFLRVLDAAQSNFQPFASTGDVVLLKSDEILAGVVEADMGWTDLVKGRLLAHRIPGWHEEIFQNDEGVARIAEILRPLLDEVDVARGQSGLAKGAGSVGSLRPLDPNAPRAAPQAIARALSSTDDAMRSMIAGA